VRRRRRRKIFRQKRRERGRKRRKKKRKRKTERTTSNLAEVPLGISTTMLTAGKAVKEEEEEGEEAALKGRSCQGLTSTNPPFPFPFPSFSLPPSLPSLLLLSAVTNTRASAVPSAPALRTE